MIIKIKEKLLKYIFNRLTELYEYSPKQKHDRMKKFIKII